MTTGLQRIPAAGRPHPFASVLRLLAAPLRTTLRSGRHHHATAPLVGTRAAHDIRRGARASAPAGVRDVHDGAILRGVFPPRV
jgi:hypothetical protein